MFRSPRGSRTTGENTLRFSVVLEAKDLHLKGSEDTIYKERLIELLNPAIHKAQFPSAGLKLGLEQQQTLLLEDNGQHRIKDSLAWMYNQRRREARTTASRRRIVFQKCRVSACEGMPRRCARHSRPQELPSVVLLRYSRNGSSNTELPKLL